MTCPNCGSENLYLDFETPLEGCYDCGDLHEESFDWGSSEREPIEINWGITVYETDRYGNRVGHVSVNPNDPGDDPYYFDKGGKGY